MKANKKVLLFPIQPSNLVAKTISRRYWQLIVSLVILITFSSFLISPAIAADEETQEIQETQDQVSASNSDASSVLKNIYPIAEQLVPVLEYLQANNDLSNLIEIFIKCNGSIEADPTYQHILEKFHKGENGLDMNEEEFAANMRLIAERFVQTNPEHTQRLKEAAEKTKTSLEKNPINIDEPASVQGSQNNQLPEESLELRTSVFDTMIGDMGSLNSELRNQQAVEVGQPAVGEKRSENQRGFWANSVEYWQKKYPEYFKEPGSHWGPVGFLHQFGYAFGYKYLETNAKETDSSNPYVRTLGIESLAAAGAIAYKYDKAWLDPKEYKRGNTLVSLLGKAAAVGMAGDKEIVARYYLVKVQGEIIKNILMIALLRSASDNPLKAATDKINFDVDRFAREAVANLYETWMLEKWTTCDIFARLVKAALLSINCDSGSKSMKKWKFLVTIAPHISSMCNAGCKWTKHEIGKAAQKRSPMADEDGNYWCTSELKADGSSVAVCGGDQVVRKLEINEKQQQIFASIPTIYGNVLGRGPNQFWLHRLYGWFPREIVLRLFSWGPSKLMGTLSGVNPITYPLVDKLFEKTYPLFRPLFAAVEVRLGTTEVNGKVNGKDNAFALTKVVIEGDPETVGVLTLRNRTGNKITITKIEGYEQVCPLVIASHESAEVTLEGIAKNTHYAFPTEYMIGDDEVTNKYLHGMIWFRLPEGQKAAGKEHSCYNAQEIPLGTNQYDITLKIPLLDSPKKGPVKRTPAAGKHNAISHTLLFEPINSGIGKTLGMVFGQSW